MSRPALRLTPQALGCLARAWSAAEAFSGSCSARAASARGLSACNAGRLRAAGAVVLATEVVAALRALLGIATTGMAMAGTATTGAAGNTLVLVVLVALEGGIEVARAGIVTVRSIYRSIRTFYIEFYG